MDEEVTLKVTRRRRSLSIEQPTDAQSPSTPSTPTKKRATRLAAKPQLDLIDENTPVTTPKRVTRKSVSRDVAEPEEKQPLTPARRSTRIKSNTSIISETSQLPVDSPRARRLARRNSLVGNDIETPLTPSRQTRRKRKESTSSIENPSEQITAENTNNDLGVVKEESDVNTHNTTNPSAKSSPRIIRKSPRISQRKSPCSQDCQTPYNLNQSRNKASNKNEEVNSNTVSAMSESSTNESSSKSKTRKSESNALVNNVEINATNLSPTDQLNSRKSEIQEVNLITFSATKKSNSKRKSAKSGQNAGQPDIIQKSNMKNDEGEKENNIKHRLSESSESLIKQVCNEPKTKSVINKTAPSREESFTDKGKRTLSLTLLTTPQHEESFHSDNEMTKKKIKTSILDLKKLNHDGSGECQENKLPLKKNKTRLSSLNNSLKTNDDLEEHSKNKSITQFFQHLPSDTKPTILFEDSSSNSGSTGKGEADDQCVPVIKVTNLPSPKHKELTEVDGVVKTVMNNSCEPMDIDESTPEDTLLLESSNVANETKRESSVSEKCNENVSRRKSSVSENLNHSKRKSSVSEKVTESTNQSKRKSSLMSPARAQSTVLNTSDVNTSNVSTSKIDVNVNRVEIVNNSHIRTNNESKMHLSLDFSGTPLTQKNVKSVMQTSTPVFNPSKEGRKLRQDSFTSKESQVTESNNSLIQAKQISSPNLVNGEKQSEKVVNKEKTKNSFSVTNIESSSENDSEDEDKTEKSSSKAEIPGFKKGQSRNTISKQNESEDKSDSEEDESEDESHERSNILNSEAEDAGDDYQSGDSQDEEEIQYEKVNEIIGNGETLTSSEEISNDSDYEKDSFLVSSDAEDEELLSGSGDDLSMSDNELTMSAKSKKKFDERKTKQQKQASREMYEARHNVSNKSDKSDVPKPSKKKNRLRLESTMLESENESMTKTSKKRKRLSESINENEITNVFDNSIVTKEDPLLMKVKPEPKTPQRKSLNISTVNLTYREEMEAVNVQENMSIVKTNETSDPLQNFEDSDDGSISENEEIKQVFESLLVRLNKKNDTKKNKSLDLSLNLNKKGEQIKAAQDELKYGKPVVETEDSNSGLDIKLLFNEDSNDSEYRADSANGTSKRIEASTNLIESTDVTDDAKDTSFNTSSKRKNNRKASESKPDAANKDTSLQKDENEGVCFFIDTKGDTSSDETSQSTMSSKKKNKDISNVSKVKDSSKIMEDLSEINTSKKKKSKKNSESDNAADRSIVLNSSKFMEGPSELNDSKKKKSKKNSESENTADSSNIMEVSSELNTSNKKIRKKNSESDNAAYRSIVLNSSKIVEGPSELNTSKKKKIKKNSESENTADSSKIMEDPSELNTSKKKKSKKDSESDNTADRSIVLNFSKIMEGPSELNNTKKKKNKKNNESENTADSSRIMADPSELNTSRKKKSKKNSESDNAADRSIVLNASKNVKESEVNTSKKNKNKHKKTNESQHDADRSIVISKEEVESLNFFVDPKGTDNDAPEEVSAKKKKKNKNTTVSFVDEEVHNASSDNTKKVKKSIETAQALNTSADKKSKKSLEKAPVEKLLDTHILEKTAGNRKRKASGDAIIIETPQAAEPIATQGSKKKRREESGYTEPLAQGTNRNKKRKDRDEEDEVKHSKIRKDGFFSKVHVPRLPEHILNQIEDKPKPSKVDWNKAKSKVVATTPFTVEETKISRRRNKPSNYLEETICLNEDSPKVKRQNKILTKPKVLPFVPSVSISSSGCTTDFKICIIPKETKFVAQTATTVNFKNDLLENRKKKYGTYELYKKHRQMKLSKF